MREIKFRGKNKQGEWAYGGYASTNASKFLAEEHLIMVQDDLGMHSVVVDKKTVGQYTGLKDDEGNKIFEGDIILFCHEDLIDYASNSDSDGSLDYDVIVNHSAWQKTTVGDNGIISGEFADWSMWTLYFAMEGGYQFKVIGNIVDNPELLDSAGIQRKEQKEIR